MLFCLNTPQEKLKNSKDIAEITFREPTESDFAGSIARRNHLPPPKELEIEYDFSPDDEMTSVQDGLSESEKRRREKEIRKNLLTVDSMGAFAEKQKKSAVDHWGIMRTVLPDAVWENW
jgi:hypothetical protein